MSSLSHPKTSKAKKEDVESHHLLGIQHKHSYSIIVVYRETYDPFQRPQYPKPFLDCSPKWVEGVVTQKYFRPKIALPMSWHWSEIPVVSFQ